jgi:ribosomal protein S27AE
MKQAAEAAGASSAGPRPPNRQRHARGSRSQKPAVLRPRIPARESTGQRPVVLRAVWNDMEQSRSTRRPSSCPGCPFKPSAFAEQWHELTPEKKVTFQEQSCPRCAEMAMLEETGKDRSRSRSRSRNSKASSRSNGHTGAEQERIQHQDPNDSGFQCRKCGTRLLNSDKVYPTTTANKEWLCRQCVRGLIEGWNDEEETGPPVPTQTDNPMHQEIMREVSIRLADRMYKDITTRQVAKKEKKED